MIENYAEALYSSGILSQAAAVLQRRLREDDANVDALHKLGEIHRKQGDLEQAARVYARLTELAPTDLRARHMHAVLTGQVPPPWPADNATLQPAPFVLLRNFLEPEFYDTLLPRVLAEAGAWPPRPAGPEGSPAGRAERAGVHRRFSRDDIDIAPR